MSFNQLIKKKSSLELAFFKEELKERMGEYQGAGTLRNQTAIESEMISPNFREEMLFKQLPELNIFKQVEADQFDSIEKILNLMHRKCMIFEREIKKNIKNRMNSIESKKVELAGKVSEIRQKLNNLSGFSEGYKFVIKEDFYNLYSINKELVNKKEMHIDLESNCATLPIKKNKKVKINKIIISNKSRGVPGNYLTGNNKLIYSVIDGDQNTFFEFFKQDSGPVKLVVNLQLSELSIINQIKVGKAFASASSSFIINDIIFNENNNTSIKKLCDKDEQTFEINATSKNGEVVITHLPIKATSVSIYLESKEYTIVEGSRKMFILGLKNIELRSIEYEKEGQFGSSRIITPENLFILKSESKVFPKMNNSYAEELSISTDNGASRNSLKYDDNKTKDLILDGKQNFLNYLYQLTRDENLVSKLANYSKEEYFVKTNSNLKVVNKKISPINYSLDSMVNENELKVVQSEILIRNALKEKAIVIGNISNAGLSKIYVPAMLKSLNIQLNEIRVFANNKEMVIVESEVDNENEVYLNYEENFLEFYLETNKNKKIKLLLKPLEAKTIHKPEGYYIEINEPFEYDKKLMEVSISTESNDIITELVPRGSKQHFLNEEHVDIINVEYETEDGWKDGDELNPNNQENGIYSVRSKEAGIIVFDDMAIEEQLRVNYKYEKKKQLTIDEFEVWGKDQKIKGIYLYPESALFKEGRFRIKANAKYENITNTKDIIEKSGSFKENPWGDNEAYREVDYIDGYTEFLNIKKMKKDYVPRMEWILGEIAFTVSQKPYVEGSYVNSIKLYKDGNVIESDIRKSNDESEIVYKFSKPENDTSVYAENYYLEYFYLIENKENVKKYSINYEKAVIHFSEPTVRAIDFDYKYGNIKVSYGIYNEISNYSADIGSGTVKVYTEEFLNINNKVRFFWNENQNEFNLEGLENYYSPIVYGLKVGMN